MKRMKRMVSLMMVFVLCLGLMPTQTFATGSSIVYLALGDSITYGTGLTDADTEGFVPLFATATDAISTTNLSQEGLTAAALAAALEGGSYDYYLQQLDPDVVTITIGGNDLMAAFYEVAAQIYNTALSTEIAAGTTDAIDAAEAKKIIAQTNADNETLAKGMVMLGLLNGTDNSSLMTESTTLRAYIDNIAENINIIAAEIREVCPDAIILIANQYNPYQWLTGYENIAAMFETGLTMLNDSLANNSTWDYEIVDVYTAFAASTVNLSNANVDYSTFTFDFDFHPNAEGHKVIAAAMKEAYDAAAEAAEKENDLTSNDGVVYRWEVPVEITVEEDGSAAAPAESFQVEILKDYYYDTYSEEWVANEINAATYGMTVTVDTVKTNGAYTYTAWIRFSAPSDMVDINDCDLADILSDGFYVRLTNVSADGWTYSEEVYSVYAQMDRTTGRAVEFAVYDYDDWAGIGLDCASFTCTYTGYTLSFDTEGGDPLESVTAAGGATISLADYVPTRSGYTFDGWYTDAAFTSSAGTSVVMDQDVTLYAKWEENTQQPSTPTTPVTSLVDNYLALGDGITTGKGLETAAPVLLLMAANGQEDIGPDNGFVSLLATAIGATTTVNKGEEGMTAADLLAKIQNGDYDDEIAAADLISITVGGNDLLAVVYEVLAEIYNGYYSTNTMNAATVQLILENATSLATLGGNYASMGYDLLKMLNSQDFSSVLLASSTFKNGVAECIENINAIATAIEEKHVEAMILIPNQYNPYLWLENCDYIVDLFTEGVNYFNAQLKANKTSNFTTILVGEAFAASTSVPLTDAYVNIQYMYGSFATQPNEEGHAVLAALMEEGCKEVLAYKYSEPVWNWATDYSSATAVFTCTNLETLGSKETLQTKTITTSAVTSEQVAAVSCETDGEYRHTATVTFFKEKYSESIIQTIKATGHTSGNTVVENEVDPTCTSAGSYENVVYCTDCGKELSRVKVLIKETGHTAGTAVKENETPVSQCEGTGSYDSVVYCTECGEELSRVRVTVGGTGHTAGTTVIENRVEPTCTEDGSYEEVVYCTVCGEVLSRVKVLIEETGHTAGVAVKENEVAATCTKDGSYDSVVYCTVCGEELSRTNVLTEATGHTHGEAVTENVVAATCTEDGSYDKVIYCTVCGEELSRETEPLKATGHTAGEAVKEKEVAATCTEDGSYDSVVYCSKCGEELSRETVTVEATGHTAGEAVKEKEVAATCTEDGSYDSVVYCSKCGEELSRETVTVEATGHTAGEAVKEKEVAATCTENGSYDSVVYCSECGEELSRETVTVDATGHIWDSGAVTLEATDTTDGVMTYTCEHCGETKTEAILATGVPATGDTANLWMWLAIAFISGGGAVYLGYTSGRRKRGGVK